MLAIGIVVDDAIVVVENVERNIEAGHGAAARRRIGRWRRCRARSSRSRWCWCAVFVPLAFISGLTGQFYRQFALTIAMSTVISAVNSLTLSPALAALLLKGHGAPKDRLTRVHGFRCFGWFFRGFNRVFGAGRHSLWHRGDARVDLAQVGDDADRLCRAGGTCPWCCSALVPGGFVPAQDKQYLVGFAQLPDGASAGPQRKK